MPAKLFSVRSRGVCVATVVCVVFLLCVTASAARGQAPWQAHPDQGQEVPPPDTPCEDGSCGLVGGGRACDSGCGDASCDQECNAATDWLHTFDGNKLSFRGEYLAWWTKSPNVPALVTTNADPTTPFSQAGVLPGAEILYGGEEGDPGLHSGARFNLEYWFSSCRYVGLDITYTFLGNASATFERTNANNAILGRPYFNTDPAVSAQDAWVIAYPNGRQLQTGGITIRNEQELAFVEAMTRWSIVQGCNRNLDFVFGYRYGRFQETLSIDDTTTSAAVGDTIQKSDLFDARNEFNGFELGFISNSRYCRWSLDVLAKLAVGNTRSQVDVGGTTEVTDAQGNTVVRNGGLLALPTNSGTVERNGFSAIPELGVTVGYDLTCQLKATVGYTFVYWSNVMRPGDQIDTNVNGLQVPPTTSTLTGSPSPATKSVMTDFWAQGLNIGLDYRF